VTDASENLYALIVEIRASFNRLRAFADTMHADLSITASMRAVMESVFGQEPQSVPEIARRKGVSRQHIQVNVDALCEKGLVELRDNPAHKRSPLVALTRKGRAAFEKIREREALALEELADGLPERNVKAALKVLRKLRQRLEQSIPGGNANA
jgi:DNA-binding MarR family transcriptional regulator